MKQLLSISSSRPWKQIGWILLISLVALFAGDRLLARAIFLFYDQWFKFSSLEDAEILAVGSSHVAFALDARELTALTGRKVGLISMPGTSIMLRYYMLRDRLEHDPPPKVILLETSRQVFDAKRYSDYAAVPDLVPYYHRGYFTDFVKIFGPRLPDWHWREASHLYAMNHAFTNFTDPRNVARRVARMFGERFYAASKVAWRQIETVNTCRPESPDMLEAAAEWKRRRGNRAEVGKIDPALEDWLHRIIALAEEKKVPVVLLDVPFLEYSDDSPSIYETRAREILRNLETGDGRVSYLSLPIANNPCFFIDTSHLNQVGQAEFTRRTAAWLSDEKKAWRLLSR